MKKFLLIIMSVLLLHTVFAATYDNSTASGISGQAISISLVNQDPDPAIAGDQVELHLAVQNAGRTAANNLIIEVIPSYPFSIVPGDPAVQNIGTVEGYQGQYNNNQQIVKYTILVDKDVTAGTYDLKVNTYQNGTTAKTQKTIAIDVKGKQNAEIIHIDKTILLPGKQTNMTFTINNVGSSPLRDLTFSWQDANDVILPVGSDNTQYIKYISVGDSASIKYQVVADTNANPGLYKLNLHLSYVDPNSGQQNISTIAGVYVGGGTDFDVAYSDSGTAQTSFSVANTGSNPAYSVSVVIPDQPGWRTTGSSSSIIGNLNKGDYTIASFSLQAMNNSARRNGTGAPGGNAGGTGTYGGNAGGGAYGGGIGGTGTGGVERNASMNPQMVLVRIVYSDTTGERQTVEKMVRVSSAGTTGTTRFGAAAATQQSFWSKYQWYIILVIVIVGGYVGFTFYKKRKLRMLDTKKKK